MAELYSLTHAWLLDVVFFTVSTRCLGTCGNRSESSRASSSVAGSGLCVFHVMLVYLHMLSVTLDKVGTEHGILVHGLRLTKLKWWCRCDWRWM